jgi:cysteinyl-tRNA synthetase
VELKLYNTLSKVKELFVPIDNKDIRLYVCGPTVYDLAHIGNARPVIVFDLLYRILKHVYGEYNVTYVRNITDVDDKINNRAYDEYPNMTINDAINKITAPVIKSFHEDIADLGCINPDFEPKATEYIIEMQEIVLGLIKSKNAYVSENHVLFDVTSYKNYGKLTNRTLKEMISGSRIDVASYKRHPLDFVLWKPSSEKDPGWESPWGYGRPGWHLECSAMSTKYFGSHFDIHGGGIDLIFPHHENEISQSCCFHKEDKMANFFIHNGILNVEGKKMSKSLGNIQKIKELLKKWPSEVIRLNMLRTHYRQPIDWTEVSLKESWLILNKWYDVIDDKEMLDENIIPAGFVESLYDDINSPLAISKLHEFYKESNYNDLKLCSNFLGLLKVNKEDWKNWIPLASDIEVAQIEMLITEREESRKNKDFAKSDKIRDNLLAKGIKLNDKKDKTTWEVI